MRLPLETCYLKSDHIKGKMNYDSMSHASHSKYYVMSNMTQTQEAGAKKQLLLKSRAHRFYTTNISHCDLH